MTEKQATSEKTLSPEEEEVVRIYYVELIGIRVAAGIYEEAIFLIELIAKAREKYLKESESNTDLFLKIINETAQELIEKTSETKIHKINEAVSHVLLGTAKISFDKYRETEEIKRIADIDTLIELPKIRTLRTHFEKLNHYYVEKRLSQKHEKAKSFSFVMMDVDNFKNINDTYGHLAGDEILKHIADTLKSVLRDSDGIYRYGGDEFSLLLEGNEVDIKALLGRLLEKFRDTKFKIEDNKGQTHRINVEISIGSVSSERLEANPGFNVFYKAADEALYKAKKAGKNQIFQVGTDQEAE